MRKMLVVSIVVLLLLAGCADSAPPEVSLSSPGDGSTVESLTPILTWGGPAGAVYRVLVVSDSNFQDLVLDAESPDAASFTVPEGTLEWESRYYWKVLAVSGSEETWSEPRAFNTPAGAEPEGAGNLTVNAALDGVLWDGSMSYRVTGPFTDSEDHVPGSFENLPAGLYTVTYSSGGPAGTTLSAVEPAPSQELKDGETLDFLLHFYSTATAVIKIGATLNGEPWSGHLRYKISGPYKDADDRVPQTLGNLPPGQYTLFYRDGGPEGALLQSITPSSVKDVAAGETVTFTLNFETGAKSNLQVSASFNGSAWTGPAEFSLSGPVSGNYSSLPLELKDVPPGEYRVSFKSGGPAGGLLKSISPAEKVVIKEGRSGGFVFNFATGDKTGSMEVRATLNGSPWSGFLDYRVLGPLEFADDQVPRAYRDFPPGDYTVSYKGGGPENAALAGITPAPTQRLNNNQTVVYYFNFVEKANKGKITVRATLDGKPWETAMGSGAISYTITGPADDSHDAIPGVFDRMPAGVYTVTLNHGGPTGAVLTGISPSPAMSLEPGGSLTFTLEFSGQAAGNVSVMATIDGEPWSGPLDFVLQGPYVESGNAVPSSFSSAPPGQYSVQYVSGGPPQSELVEVSPPSKALAPGGTLNFTFKFRFISGVLPED